MFARTIDQDLELVLPIPQYSTEIYSIIEENRDFLSFWHGSIQHLTTVESVQSYIKDELYRFAENQALNLSILFRKKVVGAVGFSSISYRHASANLQYWLAESYTGKGIMARSVDHIISLGFEYYPIRRIHAECATGNIQSRKVLERLGFSEEGIVRQCETLGDRVLDHVVYGLLKSEFRQLENQTSKAMLSPVLA